MTPDQIRDRYAEGMSMAGITRLYGISMRQVENALKAWQPTALNIATSRLYAECKAMGGCKPSDVMVWRPDVRYDTIVMVECTRCKVPMGVASKYGRTHNVRRPKVMYAA